MNEAVKPFVWPVRVYYEDTDLGGVVQHAQYVKFLERARTEWLRAGGIEQDTLMRETEILFVVTRVDIRYRRPAHFNDLLEISVALTSATKTRFVCEQKVARAGAAAEPLVVASVEIACVDRPSFRARALPPILLARMAS
ncbi:MAG TPA: tol-pal system-associated acyl-CoA thioesterase [Gammaproteobacteria bacterium]|nr:tol-pal system-associated acyl-CoA thioesterase [Gammaproteobacteria bacterium]